MKVILYILGVMVILIGIGITWILVTRPDLDEIRARAEERYTVSEISYPENYSELVRKEMAEGESFLLNDTVHSIVYERNFPFSKRKLDTEKTIALLKILSDSTSYRWGEFGTPDYDLVVVYYEKNGDEVGYTLIDPVGEVENCPYRSVMKWGVLTDEGYTKLMMGLSLE